MPTGRNVRPKKRKRRRSAGSPTYDIQGVMTRAEFKALHARVTKALDRYHTTGVVTKIPGATFRLRKDDDESQQGG